MHSFLKAVENLRAGSIVVLIDQPELCQTVRNRNPNVTVYSVSTMDLGTRPVTDSLLIQHLGKIPTKRPRMHFQMDLLSVSKKEISLLNELRPFVHPGGQIFCKEEKMETVFPKPSWDLGIAKLKDSEKQFLSSHVSQLKPGSIYVEIGTYKGGSAVLAAVSNPEIQIYAVDIWQEGKPAFQEFCRHTQFFPQIQPIQVSLEHLEKGPALIAEKEGVNLEDLQIDFLFVDGDHSYQGALTDLKIYDPYSKFVCGHDFLFGNDVHAAALNYYQNFSRFQKKSLGVKLEKAILKQSQFLGNHLKVQGSDSSIWYRA